MNEPPLECHHFFPAWLLRSQVCTPTQYIEPISVSVFKKSTKRRRFASKSVTTNEPPLGYHHLLHSWLLRSQVCTPSQCIEHISVSVFKKSPEKEEICLKNWHNERPPSRVSSPLTFMAASQPSLYTYPVYRNHLCRCFQKVARKGGDLPQKASRRMSPL